MNRPIRVLHCPSDVGGNAWTLAQAERRLGIESRVMVFSSHWYGYHTDIDLHLKERSLLGKIATLANFFLKAAFYYDVFHFNFGSSMFAHFPGPLAVLNQMDLPLLKRCGKGIVVTYQGCDARQQSYCRKNMPITACWEPNCYGGKCSPRVDAERAQRAARFDRYADRIFALNPDLLRVLPPRTEFLPYTTIDLDEWKLVEASPLGRSERFVILHSPTQREVKGTGYILEAVDHLRSHYPEVELMLVEGIPHDQVQPLYNKADLVIDQLLLGWYGGFAVEAMALSKPVVCYIREDDLRFLPVQMKTELPMINANPSNLYEVLLRTLEMRSLLRQVGERSRLFVETWHDPNKIARQMQQTYEAILQR